LLTARSGIIASSLSVLTQVTRRMVGVVSLIIMARILSPEDYGLVAIALIFLNFIDVISNTGGKSYLLSQETLTDELVYTSWTLGFLLKGTLSVLLAISSYPISLYYDDPRLMPIILVFSLQSFIGLLGSPGMIYKYKNQELGAITKWQIISRFVTTGITISIAIIYETYWALVIGQFLITVSQVSASYVIAPKLPRLSLSNIREQWDFSKWILPQSVLNFFRSQLDVIFVSGSFEKAMVGGYNSMRYYANIPTTMFINPASGPLLTQFSQFKNNPAYFAKQLQVVMFYMSLISTPIIYLMYNHAEYVVELILGSKWLPYAGLLAIFSFFTIVMTLNNTLSQIVMLKGKTSLLFAYSVYSLIAQAVLFLTFDFESIFQLAEYKISLDVISVLLFFVIVVWLYVGKSAFGALLLPVLPAIALILFSGKVAFLIIPGVDSILTLIAHSLITSVLFGGLQLALIFSLKDRVHCYGYTVKLMTPLLKVIRTKLDRNRNAESK